VTTISYHSFGPASNRAYVELLSGVLADEAARLGVEVVLDTTPGASLGAKQSRGLHPLDVAVLTSRVWRAARSGADAAVVGNIQDPGLVECRELVAIPVVGLLESLLTGSYPFGRSVAFICTNRRVEPLLRERIAACGMSERLHGFAFLDVDLAELSRGLARGDAQALGRVAARVAELEAGLRAGGAQVVATGSALLDVLLRSRGERREDTLVSPIAVAVATARAAADMRRAGVPVGAGSLRPDEAEVARYMARVEALVAIERDGGAPVDAPATV
jgi:Asp/Glu/hydantoin racemase